MLFPRKQTDGYKASSDGFSGQRGPVLTAYVELRTANTIDWARFDVQSKLLMRAITMFDGGLDLLRQPFAHGDPDFIPVVRMIFPDFNIQHSRLPKGPLIDNAIYHLVSRLLAGFLRQ